MRQRRPGPSGPSVSVVIAARNAAATLGRQLEALAGQERAPAFDVVVADNGSTDHTAAIALGFRDRLDIAVVDASRRQGVATARNVGTEAARGDLILYCDADDVVSADWVAQMVAAAPGVDVIGGTLLPLDEDARGLSEFFPAQRGGLSRGGYLWYAIGANMGCWRDVYDQIGGWDPGFPRAGDDVDFCLRAQKAGFRLGGAPAATVLYAVRPSLWSSLQQRCSYGRASHVLEVKHGLAARPVGAQVLVPIRHLLGVLVSRGRRRRKELGLLATELGKARGALESASAAGPLGALATVLQDLLHLVVSLPRSLGVRHTFHRGTGPSVPFTSAPGSPVSGLGLVAPSPDGVRSVVASTYSQAPLQPLTVAWLQAVVRPGGRAVDVGADVGMMSILLAGLVGASGEVVAVEPSPVTVSCLRENLSRHASAHVEVHPMAVSDLRRADAERLDDLLRERTVDLVRLAIEGGAPAALRGGERVLKQNPRLKLVVELNPGSVGRDHDLREMVSMLEREGFSHVVAEDDPSSPWKGRVRSTRNVLEDWEHGRLPRSWYANLLCSRSAAELPACTP